MNPTMVRDPTPPAIGAGACRFGDATGAGCCGGCGCTTGWAMGCVVCAIEGVVRGGASGLGTPIIVIAARGPASGTSAGAGAAGAEGSGARTVVPHCPQNFAFSGSGCPQFTPAAMPNRMRTSK